MITIRHKIGQIEMIKFELSYSLNAMIHMEMVKFLHRYLLLFSLLGMSHSMLAQFNVKVGYIPALGSFETISNLFADYNTSNSDIIETPFNELGFMHGIDVGLRYKIGALGIEADWYNLSRERDALLYFSQSDSFGSRLYKIGISSFSIGLDSYIDRFGFGEALHSQKLKISREIGDNDLNLTNETNLALDIHLNIALQKGNKVSLFAKPYYRFSLKDYDLNTFSQDLLDKDTVAGGLTYYGITLVFYNGNK